MHLPNECTYDILKFLKPKELLLCYQLDLNFSSLCKLDSLWQEINNLFELANTSLLRASETFDQKPEYEISRICYPLYKLFINKQNNLRFVRCPSFSYFDGENYTGQRHEDHYLEAASITIEFKNKDDIDSYKNCLRMLNNLKIYDKILIHASPPKLHKIRKDLKPEFNDALTTMNKKNVEIQERCNRAVKELEELGCYFKNSSIGEPRYETSSDDWFDGPEFYDATYAHIVVGYHSMTYTAAFLKVYGDYFNISNLHHVWD